MIGLCKYLLNVQPKKLTDNQLSLPRELCSRRDTETESGWEMATDFRQSFRVARMTWYELHQSLKAVVDRWLRYRCNTTSSLHASTNHSHTIFCPLMPCEIYLIIGTNTGSVPKRYRRSQIDLIQLFSSSQQNAPVVLFSSLYGTDDGLRR